MGQIINPISYRLGKTKFWKNVWCYKTKKNYKKLLIEDINLKKLINWFFSILNWNSIGIILSNFNIIKAHNVFNLFIIFFFKRKKKKNKKKKLYFKFSLKSKFINFFVLRILRKKYKNSFLKPVRKKYVFDFKKKRKRIFKILNRKKKYKNFNKRNDSKYHVMKNEKFNNKRNDSKYHVMKNEKFNNKRNVSKYPIKRKKINKYNKNRYILATVLFKYFRFFLKKNSKFKLYYKKFFNYFYYKHIVKKNYYSWYYNCIKFRKSKKPLLKKRLFFKKFDYNFFFRVISCFLNFFIKKIFKINNVLINLIRKKKLYINTNFLKNLVKKSVYIYKNKVFRAIKRLLRKLKARKKMIVGFKIGYFGRYEKKLRNKKVWILKGSLSPSNINSPLSYKNFFILLKQGLCGVKITYLINLEKNEIFKKKTFINKAF